MRAHSDVRHPFELWRERSLRVRHRNGRRSGAGGPFPGARKGRRRVVAVVAAATTWSCVIPLVSDAASKAASGSPVPLPKVIKGGLVDTEFQTNWSVGPAHFIGMRTDYSFTRFVFSPGKLGPYTLGKDAEVIVETLPITIRMSSPAASDGTCHATFDFGDTGNRLHSALSGNIGGLSETSGGWNLTIQLRLVLHGKIVYSYNCGPNDEFTASQFGQPPTMSVPIIITAKLDSAKGEIPIDVKSLMTLGDGTGEQTDHLVGTLRSQ